MSELDEVAAHAVADWFLATNSRPADPAVCLAYRTLQVETDQAFWELTTGQLAPPFRVVFTECRDPYASDDELIDAVRTTRVLEVTCSELDRDRPHPMLDNDRGGAYDRFRAVHDLIGHAHCGFGFDRQGEFAAWQAQEHMYSPLARLALATELHAEHSVRWTTGNLAEHKAALMPIGLLARTRRGAASDDAVPR